MNEIMGSALWIAVGIGLVWLWAPKIPRRDRRFVWVCFWAHMASAFALIWLTYNYFGRGDIQVYYYYGEQLAEYIRRDPGRWGPEIGRLILQMPVSLPIDIYGHEGSSTTTMIGLSAVMMVINQSSEMGTAIAFSLLAFSGQMAMYAAFREHFPRAYRRRLMMGLLLVPSAVFWTSGVLKEAVALGGLGWMVWGLHLWIVRGHRWRAAAWVGAGGVLVGISKSYILFPLMAAAGIWWFWHRSMAMKGSVGLAEKPLYMVGAAVMAVVGMVGLGELFPQYSVGSLAEEAANLQYQGERIEGGSSYAMGNPDETTLMGQLAFAPVAMSAALFRPFIIEAHNAVALVNGLEMTALLVMWLRIFWVRGVGGVWRVVSGSPALVFCVVFVGLFGLGVGLATTNFGTLSRYRVPMMPMYVMTLLLLYPGDAN